MTLSEQAASYVAVKQATGYSFVRQARFLGSFAAHAEAQGDQFVRIATALDWASQASTPNQRIIKLHLVRSFAMYLHAEDPRHEVPHRHALGRRSWHRPPPHILSTDQVKLIMNAALELPPTGSITPHVIHTIIGLLAATGMRTIGSNRPEAQGSDQGWHRGSQCKVRQVHDCFPCIRQ